MDMNFCPQQAKRETIELWTFELLLLYKLLNTFYKSVHHFCFAFFAAQ